MLLMKWKKCSYQGSHRHYTTKNALLLGDHTHCCYKLCPIWIQFFKKYLSHLYSYRGQAFYALFLWCQTTKGPFSMRVRPGWVSSISWFWIFEKHSLRSQAEDSRKHHPQKYPLNVALGPVPAKSISCWILIFGFSNPSKMKSPNAT